MITIFFNIFIISLVVVPMIYFFVSGNSGNKVLKKAFKQKAKDAGIQIDTFDVWQKGAIGLDSKNGKICYTYHKGSDEPLHIVDIHDISHCQLSKYYHKATVHHTDTQRLHNVSILLKNIHSKEDITIQFYNSDETLQVEDDLMIAAKWEKIIGAFAENLKFKTTEAVY